MAQGIVCNGKKVRQGILQSVEGGPPKVAANLHEFEALCALFDASQQPLELTRPILRSNEPTVSAHFAQLETVIMAETSGGFSWATSLQPTSDSRLDMRWAGNHDVLSERDWIDATRDRGNTVTIFLPYRPPQGLGNRRRLAYESRGWKTSRCPGSRPTGVLGAYPGCWRWVVFAVAACRDQTLRPRKLLLPPGGVATF